MIISPLVATVINIVDFGCKSCLHGKTKFFVSQRTNSPISEENKSIGKSHQSSDVYDIDQVQILPSVSNNAWHIVHVCIVIL